MTAPHVIPIEDAGQCIPCSICDAFISVSPPVPGMKLMEVICNYCGNTDIYHTNVLQAPSLGTPEKKARRGQSTNR